MTKLWTIRDAAHAMRQGEVTPVDLLNQCLERVDQYESKVKAWVLIDRDRAMADAKAATEEMRRGQFRSTLHGIPIGIKDIIDVFDWPTACGSRLWAKSFARADADAVHYLRRAGAVLMGKTVTTQYASFDPPPTRNPWNLDRTPGGSSSGSAAAVACGMCLGALGSQTGGSITRPAAYCGVPSCKPSFGTVRNLGVLPLAHSMDHVGPIANCVEDLASILATIMAARSYRSKLEKLEPYQMPPLLRARGMFEEMAEAVARKAMDEACNRLVAAGARLEELVLPGGFSAVLEEHRVVMAVEAAGYHAERLARHPEDYDPKITELLHEGLACSATRYEACKRRQMELSAALGNPPDWRGYAAVLVPATTGPAPDASTTGNPAFNSPWSFLGYPTVSIPCARSDDGMPLSLQLVGERHMEDTLLQAAAWCEAILPWDRRLPPI